MSIENDKISLSEASCTIIDIEKCIEHASTTLLYSRELCRRINSYLASKLLEPQKMTAEDVELANSLNKLNEQWDYYKEGFKPSES